MTLRVQFPFRPVLAESPACLKPHSSALYVNQSPHTDLYSTALDLDLLAGTANKLLVCLWHCQWKRLVCKAQTTNTTLLNKKALVKAFGSDAILMGVTCKYATAATYWPSRCFVLCTHVRQKHIDAIPINPHAMQSGHVWLSLWFHFKKRHVSELYFKEQPFIRCNCCYRTSMCVCTCIDMCAHAFAKRHSKPYVVDYPFLAKSMCFFFFWKKSPFLTLKRQHTSIDFLCKLGFLVE